MHLFIELGFGCSNVGLTVDELGEQSWMFLQFGFDLWCMAARILSSIGDLRGLLAVSWVSSWSVRFRFPCGGKFVLLILGFLSRSSQRDIQHGR